MVEEGEREPLFNADAARAKAAVREGRGEELRRVFVFLPGTDFGGIQQRFAHAGFFERGGNEDRLASARNDQGEEAFAEPPVDAGEIVEGSARADENRVEGWIGFGHEGLRVEKAGVELVGGDWADTVAKRFQG